MAGKNIVYCLTLNLEKLKKIFLSFIITVFVTGCSSSKYMEEIPLKITFDETQIREYLHINNEIEETDKSDYEENLTDDQLRVKEKYSIILRVLPEEIKNYDFYLYIDKWIGTGYASKGFTKDSLNIAPFTQVLYDKAYGKSIPNTASEIFKSDELEKFTGRDFLQEGDIIFFRYHKDNPISDLAIYLRNDKILASTKTSGLAIFSFNDPYFQTRYVASARIKPEKEN